MAWNYGDAFRVASVYRDHTMRMRVREFFWKFFAARGHEEKQMTATEVDADAVPEMEVADGKIVKIKKTAFPNTETGQQAYCDYQIALYHERKDAIAEKFRAVEGRLQKAIDKVEKLKDALR